MPLSAVTSPTRRHVPAASPVSSASSRRAATSGSSPSVPPAGTSTDADEVVLVTVDRHTVGPSVEVPAGGTDGEDPLVAARRELEEETGLTAGTWRQVGEVSALNGICRAAEVVYLATDLRAACGDVTSDDADRSGDQVAEGISAVSRVPVAEALAMIRRGEITDGETVAALMLALLELGRVS